MDDRQILDEIKRIVDREHQLRAEVEQARSTRRSSGAS